MIGLCSHPRLDFPTDILSVYAVYSLYLLDTGALASKQLLQRWRMAPSTFDIVVLSSSPPDNARASANGAAPQSLSPSPLNTHRVGMSALSPLQLSPLASALRKSTGALKSGSRAATVPEGALRGFATARSLVADCDDDELLEFDWGLDRTETAKDGPDQGTTQPRKRSEKAAAAGSGAEVPKPKPKPKPRARKSKTDKDGDITKPATTCKRANAPTTSLHFPNAATIDSVEASDDPPSKAKVTKPRKPRTKKTPVDGEIQTTIKKTRITKPRGSIKTTKAAQENTAEVLSAHFRDTADADKHNTALIGDGTIWDVPLSPSGKKTSVPKQRPPDDQPLELDEAVIRRRDWTPIRDTELLHTITNSSEKENQCTEIQTGKGSFTSLLSDYSYARSELASDATTSKTSISEGTGVMKRRRVEVCSVVWRMFRSMVLM
jgi:hypothetical protein